MSVHFTRTAHIPGQSCLHPGNLGNLKELLQKAAIGTSVGLLPRLGARHFYTVTAAHGHFGYTLSTAINESTRLWYACARGFPLFFSGRPQKQATSDSPCRVPDTRTVVQAIARKRTFWAANARK